MAEVTGLVILALVLLALLVYSFVLTVMILSLKDKMRYFQIEMDDKIKYLDRQIDSLRDSRKVKVWSSTGPY
jgi:hypothetical protein